MKTILASLASIVLLLCSFSTFAMEGSEKHKTQYSKEQSEITLTDGSNTSIVYAASTKGFQNATSMEPVMIQLSFCSRCGFERE